MNIETMFLAIVFNCCIDFELSYILEVLIKTNKQQTSFSLKQPFSSRSRERKQVKAEVREYTGEWIPSCPLLLELLKSVKDWENE